MSADDGSARDAPDEPERPDRRRLLGYGGLAALVAALGVGAGVTLIGDEESGEEPTPTPTATERPTSTPDEDLLALVERFAPDLHFGARERWFPTDPSVYAERGGDPTVVDGFDALVGYTEDYRQAGVPPHPTVFYHPVPVNGDVVALQYWFYSVFDQFTVNFHWHDWELLQVFVDRASGEPILLSASAHARSCPNNEFLGPDPDRRPAVLAEVGSHSSATDVNDRRPSFERLVTDLPQPDVTNAFLRPLDRLVEQPFAYGLPRDEGLPLPYVLPELDGRPINEHPDVDLPLDAFVPQDVTVRSWEALARPPDSLPPREDGTVLAAPDSSTAGTASYALRPLSDVSESLESFTGPQLSFEFPIPGFIEDRVAEHITTPGIPWEDLRTDDPASDITDPAHHRAVTGAAPSGLGDRVVGAVSALVAGAGGHVDALDGGDAGSLAPHVSVSLESLPLEVAVLLRSEPTAQVTAGGVFRFLGVEPGPHELVVAAPGLAPYATGFDHDGGAVRPAASGRVAVVPREDAVRLRADRRDGSGVARVRVEEEYVGPVYDGRPLEADRFAVPVHEAGRYTVTVTDRNGVSGSVRVDGAEVDGTLPEITLGKAALARELADYLLESAILARELGGGETADGQRTVSAAFEAAGGDAAEAADLAAEGEAAGANERLVSTVDRLIDVRGRLADAREYDAAARSALRHRASVGVDRAETAYATPIDPSS